MAPGQNRCIDGSSQEVIAFGRSSIFKLQEVSGHATDCLGDLAFGVLYIVRLPCFRLFIDIIGTILNHKCGKSFITASNTKTITAPDI